MRCKSYVLLALGFFLLPAVFAAEIDSVTPRKLKLDNSLAMINAIFNERLQQGIDRANALQDDIEAMEPDEFCDEDDLYNELRKAVFQSYTASWGLKGYDLDLQLRELLASVSYSLSLNDSIYRDIDYLEGFSLRLKELSDVVNVNGQLIGLDKIGHFFAEGWQYFELTRYHDKSIEQALQWGRRQESGKFGYTTTGIYSFADLAANLNGWRFWNNVLLTEHDPLKGKLANFFNRPYVRCEYQLLSSVKNSKLVKAWQLNSRFDLADYIDGAWDEANNCNSYADPFIEEKVKKRTNDIAPDFRCPQRPEQCRRAQQKYGDYAKHVLHPLCLMATDH